MRYVYDAVIYLLGGRCAVCGSTENLSVDHVDGITWDRHSVGREARVKRYRDELFGIYRHPDGGEVRLRCLCGPCNSKYQPEHQYDTVEPTQEEIANYHANRDDGVPF